MTATAESRVELVREDDGEATLWERHPSSIYLAAAVFLVAFYGVAIGIHQIWFQHKGPYVLASGVSVYALLFVLALAIERVIQPFSARLGPDTEAAKAERAAAATDQARADAQAKVDDSRNKTAIVTWGLASGLGFVFSSVLNVTVLGTILAAGPTKPWYPVDLLITGLVIGAGTKPLNDLVTRLQNKDSGKTGS